MKDWQKRLQAWWAGSTPVVIAVSIIAAIVLVIVFLPGRTAAVILGVVLAGVLRITWLASAQRTTQIALLWLGLGIVGDAAYARLNDLGPVTMANALMKIVDALVKLIDPVLRSFILLPPDFRARLGSVTPDFVWAFILGLTALLAYTLLSRRS